MCGLFGVLAQQANSMIFRYNYRIEIRVHDLCPVFKAEQLGFRIEVYTEHYFTKLIFSPPLLQSGSWTSVLG